MRQPFFMSITPLRVGGEGECVSHFKASTALISLQGMSIPKGGSGQNTSEFVHLRDLGYSSSGIRKVAIDLSDGEEVALKLLQRGSQVQLPSC